MIKFLKCVPIKEGKFYTIILQGDADTDEIALIHLRGKPIKIVESVLWEDGNKSELLKNIQNEMQLMRQSLHSIDNKISELQKEDL